MNHTTSALAIAALLATPLTTTAAEHLGDLALEGTLFWNEGRVGAPGIYSIPTAPSSMADTSCELGVACYEFTLEVTETGEDARLRLGYDTPMRDDNFKMTITDPEGTETTRTNGNQYSVEAMFESPAVGTWHILLAPYSAEEAPFRLRAKLEEKAFAPKPDADGRLLPNLRVTRLWEFTFSAPLNPLNGLFPPDDINPPLEVAGFAPVSCAVDETAGNDGDPAVRCLRYSFGMANIGKGVFDIRWAGDRTTIESHSMFQCIELANGEVEAYQAGDGAFHPTHGHWHYEDVVFHELFKVDRSTDPPSLVSTGNGKKIGYSPADQSMSEWHTFDQAAPGSSGRAGNCAPGATSRLGMSQGWGDSYRYQRPGNYVDFGLSEDGEYVVKTVADPLDHVLETDETDNTAYAHLMVTGNSVERIESGLGQSPWDPNKSEYIDWWTGSSGGKGDGTE